MKRFSEQFHNKAKTVSLQSFEREELRTRVISYMEYHPLPESMLASKSKVAAKSLSYPFIQVPFLQLFKWPAVAMAVMLIIVPTLAERSAPGDSLYAIKVSFNEEVISTLQLTPYEKVEWETKRLNRRISEARLLVSEGKLTDEVEAEIAAAVKEHTETVRQEIDAMRENDADQATLATIELNTTLQAQSDAFEEEGSVVMALTMSEATSDNPAQLVVDAINESLTEQGSKVEASTIPAYDKIMARVEINTTRAHELLTSLHLNPEEKFFKDVSRRLEDVNRGIENANGIRGENEKVASEQLLAALQKTQKIIVFMSDATVNAAVDIETVVPIVYTNDEYRAQLVLLSEDINRKTEIISILSPQVSTDAAGKAAYAVDIAESNQAIIASSTEAGNSVNLAKESLAVLDDVIRLFESEGVTVRSVPAGAAAEIEPATTTEAVVEEGGTVETLSQ
jgi:hypothetical protein